MGWESIVGTLLSSVVGGLMNKSAAQSQASESRKSARENMAMWQATSKPNAAAVEAAGVQNRGELGQARASSYQNLAENLAARGFGSGSGLGALGASNIESGYLQGLGKQQTELTKYANTPFWGPPSSAYASATTSPTAAGLQGASNPLQSAMGFYTMKQMFGGGNQSNSFYNPNDPYTNYAFNFGPSYMG